jgi:hypothetical protein
MHAACSSSFVALNDAISDIKAGVVDYAVVGGASAILRPQTSLAFGKLNMLSPEVGSLFSNLLDLWRKCTSYSRLKAQEPSVSLASSGSSARGELRCCSCLLARNESAKVLAFCGCSLAYACSCKATLAIIFQSSSLPVACNDNQTSQGVFNFHWF